MVASTGRRELAALQSQAHEIERDIRVLRSKLSADSGLQRSERVQVREEVTTLTRTLAGIRDQELTKKRELGFPVGMAAELRGRRTDQAAAERRARDMRTEMDWDIIVG